MPKAGRHWLKANRSALARQWNLLTGLTADQLSYARYASRLTCMFPSAPWRRLRLFALDATRIALSQLERNAERDRDDRTTLRASNSTQAATFGFQPHPVGLALSVGVLRAACRTRRTSGHKELLIAISQELCLGRLRTAATVNVAALGIPCYFSFASKQESGATIRLLCPARKKAS